MPVTKVTKLQVIAIFVSNIEVSVAFYSEKLGFEECGAYPPGKLLSSGEVTIYLEKRSDPTSDLDSSPSVVPVFGSDSISKSYEKLMAAGVTIEKPIEQYGPEYANFQIKDPDGNTIEFAGAP